MSFSDRLELPWIVTLCSFPDSFSLAVTDNKPSTLISNVTTTINNYNTNNLTKFDSAFRYSPFTTLIDETDDSITSNITTINLSKDFTPTLNTSTKYTVPFSNPLYNPHSGHNTDSGGILS